MSAPSVAIIISDIKPSLPHGLCRSIDKRARLATKTPAVSTNDGTRPRNLENKAPSGLRPRKGPKKGSKRAILCWGMMGAWPDPQIQKDSK